MRNRHFAAFVAALLLSATGAAAQTVPTTETFARDSAYTTASLSPDGTRVAFVVPQDGGDRVVVLSFTDPSLQRAYNFDRSAIFGIEWIDNETALVQMRGRFTSYPTSLLRSYIIRPATEDRPSFLEYQSPANSAEGAPVSQVLELYDIVEQSPDASFLMAASVYRQAGQMNTWASSTPFIVARDLLTVTKRNGFARPFEYGTEWTAKWFTDGTGSALARIDILNSGRQVIYVPQPAGFREVASLDDNVDNRADILGLSLDGQSLLVRARRAARVGVYPISLQNGTWGEPIFLSPEFDADDAVINRQTRRVDGITYRSGVSWEVQYFDPEMEAIHTTLGAALPGHAVTILSVSDDKSKVLVEIASASRPRVLGLFDRTQSSLSTVLESNDGLVNVPLGAVSEHVYTATDGSELRGVLVLPPGENRTNLPLVVLGHTASAPTFDTMAHFLAARGYAVFRPALRQLKRFRDVSGMDELGEWILDVQEDINAGIDDLASRGIVDSARVCIAGEDEEAYTALISTVYSSDAYRCAISIDGMTDLQRIVRWARYFNDNPVNSYNSALIRNYDLYAQEDLARFSPIHHAAEVNATFLLIGNNMDDHTESMVAALRRAGKQVQYVETRYNGDEPALYREENRLNTYRALESFLAAQIGGN